MKTKTTLLDKIIKFSTIEDNKLRKFIKEYSVTNLESIELWQLIEFIKKENIR